MPIIASKYLFAKALGASVGERGSGGVSGDSRSISTVSEMIRIVSIRMVVTGFSGSLATGESPDGLSDIAVVSFAENWGSFLNGSSLFSRSLSSQALGASGLEGGSNTTVSVKSIGISIKSIRITVISRFGISLSGPLSTATKALG